MLKDVRFFCPDERGREARMESSKQFEKWYVIKWGQGFLVDLETCEGMNLCYRLLNVSGFWSYVESSLC